MQTGKTFKSLEVPANYFGCHVSAALVAIIIPVTGMLGFLVFSLFTAILVLLASVAVAAAIFGVGAWLGQIDPYWVESGFTHVFAEETYLDV